MIRTYKLCLYILREVREVLSTGTQLIINFNLNVRIRKLAKLLSKLCLKRNILLIYYYNMNSAQNGDIQIKYKSTSIRALCYNMKFRI